MRILNATAFVGKLREQIETEADIDFLFNELEFDQLLGQDKAELLEFAKSELTGYVEDWVHNEASNFDPDQDPDDFFDDLKFQLAIFGDLFPHDKAIATRVDDGLKAIEEKVDELKFKAFEHDSTMIDEGPRPVRAEVPEGLSIFDYLAD